MKYRQVLYKFSSQKSEVYFNFRPIVRHNFTWDLAPAYPCLIKQMSYPGRLIIYVLIIPIWDLIKFKARDFEKSKPVCCGIYHCHSGEAKFLVYYISTWFLLSSLLIIQAYVYQVKIHQVQQFWLCNFLG